MFQICNTLSTITYTTVVYSHLISMG